MHLRGNLLLRDAWVWIKAVPARGTTANTFPFVAGGIAGTVGNPAGIITILISGDMH
jgi:hypothetical protein